MLDLEPIKTRLFDAPEGPWSLGRTQPQNVDKRLRDRFFESWVHVGAPENAGNAIAIVYHGGAGAVRTDAGSVESTAAMIAHAPADIAALLAEVARLRELVAALYRGADRFSVGTVTEDQEAEAILIAEEIDAQEAATAAELGEDQP